jgi:hypothetical protein
LERSEGAADNHALLFSYTRPIILIPDKIKLRPTLSAGRHWKASVLDAADNKYSFPDYTHINIDIYVDFLKLPNLKPEILLGYKDANGIFPDNALFVINKVNLFHLSLFLNYNF